MLTSLVHTGRTCNTQKTIASGETMRVGRAPHWQALPLVTDELPPGNAPLAGGGVVKPATTEMNWEFEVTTTVNWVASAPEAAADATTVLHRGGCHCGLVRFECDASAHLVAWDCNCSDCRMRRNVHFVVPEKALRILETKDQVMSGAYALAEYRFGTGTARHLFCSRCGISPFYKPRSNPDGWAVTLHCVDPGTIASVEVRRFDGQNWEAFYSGQGAAIKSFSKQPSPCATTDGGSPAAAVAGTAAADEAASVGCGAGASASETATAPVGGGWVASLAEAQFLVLPATLAGGVSLVGGVGGLCAFVVWMGFLVIVMLGCVEVESGAGSRLK